MNETGANQLAHARKALKLGEYTLAEKLLLELVSIKPSFALAHTLLGNVYELTGRSEAASDRYKQAIRIKPDYAEAYNNLGVVLKKSKDYNGALRAMEKALAIAGERADIRYNMGNVYKESNDPEKAIDEYKRAIRIDPSFALAYNNLGIVLESMGLADDAAAAYKRGLQSDGNSPRLRSNLASILEKQGNLSRAKDELARAHRSSPGRVGVTLRLATVLAKLGKHKEAIALYNDILKIDPDNIQATNNLGVEYVKVNEIGKASSCYEHALTLDPGYEKAHFNLGSILLEEGYYLEALSEIRKVIESNPGDLAAQFELGNAYLSLGRFPEAESAFNKVLSQSPKNGGALRALGNLSLKLGKYEQADRYFKKASHVADVDPSFKIDFARSLKTRENFDKSKEEISAFLKDHPEDAEAETLLAELCMKHGDMEKARITLESAIEKKPMLVQPYYLLARLYKESGNLKKSLATLDRLISLHGTRAASFDLLSLNDALSLYEEVAAKFERDEKLYEKRKFTVDELRFDESDAELERTGEDTLIASEGDTTGDAAIVNVGGVEPVITVKEEEKVITIARLVPGTTEVVKIEDSEPLPFAELLRNQVLYDEIEKLKEWANRHQRKKFADVFGSEEKPQIDAKTSPLSRDQVSHKTSPDNLTNEQHNIVDKVMEGMGNIMSALYEKRAAIDPGPLPFADEKGERARRKKKKKKKHIGKDKASDLLLEEDKREKEREASSGDLLPEAKDLREKLREYIRHIRTKLDSDAPLEIPTDEAERERIKQLVGGIHEIPIFGKGEGQRTNQIQEEPLVSTKNIQHPLPEKTIRIESEPEIIMREGENTSEKKETSRGFELDSGQMNSTEDVSDLFASEKSFIPYIEKKKSAARTRVVAGMLDVLSKLLVVIPMSGLRKNLRNRIRDIILKMRSR